MRKGASLVEVNIYAAMLTSAYQIIKANDPGDTVIVGGLINDADFTQGYSPLSFPYALEKFCTTTCFDVIGLHTYWGADLPETPRRQLLTGFYEELTMPEYVHFFSKEVARIFNQPIPIWITEVGYDAAWINELSMKINLPAPVLQAALLSQVYVSLLSVPTDEIVFWYAYVDTAPNLGDFTVVGCSLPGNLLWRVCPHQYPPDLAVCHHAPHGRKGAKDFFAGLCCCAARVCHLPGAARL